jgi:hypothetical protein
MIRRSGGISHRNTVMTQNEPKDIDAICRDGALIDRAMQAAAREAIK